jgi:hypothetical protein
MKVFDRINRMAQSGCEDGTWRMAARERGAD